MKKQNKKDVFTPSNSLPFRIGAGALSALALFSAFTFISEINPKKTSSDRNNINTHDFNKVKDDSPSAEKGHDSQVFSVQPTSEVVIEFANEEDLERMTR